MCQVNNELKRLKSQFSNVKRENEILRQVKDSLGKKLQAEEQKNVQLSKERKQKDSSSIQYESEIRELRTKLAIAEAEREAAQSLANIRVRQEKKFFLSQEESVDMFFRWVLLFWYWSLAEKLSIHPEVASINASYWGKNLKSVSPLASDTLLLSDVAELLRSPAIPVIPVDEKGKAGGEATVKATEDQDWHRRFTLQDLLHAEISLRALYEMELDNRVHSQLVERSRAQILPIIHDLANPLSYNSLDTLSLNSSVDNNLTFTYDFIIWIQLSRLWLGHVWEKAWKNRIEPHIAQSRSEYWKERAQGELSSRDVIDTQKAMKELHALQIETQIWIARSKVISDK